MAAGKIFKVMSKKPRRKASNFRKAVTAIAKKAVMNEAETKTGFVDWNLPFGANGILLPIWTSVTQGDAQQNRDGDEIHSLGVRLRGIVQQAPGIITAEQDISGVRMIVAAGKRPLTSADFPIYKGAIDPEVLTVLSDRYINYATTKRGVWMSKYIKFPRKVLYQGAAVNKNELYVFLVPFGGTGLTTTTGYQVNMGVQLYFKDL